MAGILVLCGDLTRVEADAIVNPANSHGLMGGGVALAIRRARGRVVEEEAVAQAPIPMGSAVVTSAGSMSCKYVIAWSAGYPDVCVKVDVDSLLRPCKS